MKQQRERRDDQQAFVLHAYAYRETSLIVEALTPGYGRVALVARGAKRPRSELRGVLQAFQPLTLSWAGGGELKTLIHAEWRGGLPLVSDAVDVRRMLRRRTRHRFSECSVSPMRGADERIRTPDQLFTKQPLYP